MEPTPISLLERLRRPEDRSAWERFVHLYTPLLHRWVLRLGVPRQDAADLVQDVLTLLVRKLPDFRYNPRHRFRAWLWTVTRNKCNEIRRRLPAAAVQANGALLNDLPGREDAEAETEAEYRQYLVGQALQLMREEFQPTTWQAFWESTTTHRPAAEIAVELGLSTDAVYAAKSRVLRRLRQELDGLVD
jgi:RNA polymerase sigma-70 factor (ECF subfamily)